MATVKLYARGLQIYPESNYDHDGAALKIKEIELTINQLENKTYTATDVGAEPEGSAAATLEEAKIYTDNKVQELVISMPAKGTILASYDLPAYGAINLFEIPNNASMVSVTFRVQGTDDADMQTFMGGDVINIPIGLWEVWSNKLYLSNPFCDFNYTANDHIRVSAIISGFVTTNGIKQLGAGYQVEDGSSSKLRVVGAKLHFIV